MKTRGTAAAGVALAALLLATNGCFGRAGPSSFPVGRLQVRAHLVDDHGVALDAVVTSGHTLVALGSTSAGVPGSPEDHADVLLRSTDGGITWTRTVAPLADAGPAAPLDRVLQPQSGTGLLAAGRWLVASRVVWVADQPVPHQVLALSDDAGATWQRVELPAPAGRVPVVTTATELDGRLLLGGGLRISTAPTGDAQQGRPDGDDAGLWGADASGTGFERLDAAALDGLPQAQVVRELTTQGHRVVAIAIESSLTPAGTVIDGQVTPGCCLFGSRIFALGSDGSGDRWAPLAGLPPRDPHLESVPELLPPDRGVLLQTAVGPFRLAPEATTWTAVEPPKGSYEAHPSVRVDGETSAFAWNDDQACDCSVAKAGRIEGDRIVNETVLRFHGCTDTSVRGETTVQPPVVVGSTVVASATCDDHGSNKASLAWSRDGGRHWQTTRLTKVARAAGFTDLVRSRYSANQVTTADGALVLLLTSSSGTRTDGGPIGGTLVAVRVEPHG